MSEITDLQMRKLTRNYKPIRIGPEPESERGPSKVAAPSGSLGVGGGSAEAVRELKRLLRFCGERPSGAMCSERMEGAADARHEIREEIRTRLRELVKAGALIAAEIDRLQRSPDGPNKLLSAPNALEAEVKKLTGFYNEIVAECGHDLIVREYRQRGELLRDEVNRRKEAEAELITRHGEIQVLAGELATEKIRLDFLLSSVAKIVIDLPQNEEMFFLDRTRAAIDAAIKEGAQ